MLLTFFGVKILDSALYHMTLLSQYVINVKKLQFNHVLTATRINLPTEISKNDKKGDISHRLSVGVLLNNITLLSFLLFSMGKLIRVAINT